MCGVICSIRIPVNDLCIYVFIQNYCEQDSNTKSGRKSQRSGNSRQRHENAGRSEPSGDTGETVLTKKVRGFSDSEIRKFVKSYRKFGKTKSR